PLSSLVFSNAPATTAISTLSLHDALPISKPGTALAALIALAESHAGVGDDHLQAAVPSLARGQHDLPAAHARLDTVSHRVLDQRDRKSTRLNSSHVEISYAVFCLKKKNNK